jgi:ubiquitin-protein ligase
VFSWGQIISHNQYPHVPPDFKCCPNFTHCYLNYCLFQQQTVDMKVSARTC